MSDIGEEVVVSFSVRSTPNGRHFWIKNQVTDAALVRECASANVMLLPWLNHREGVPVSFPDGTEDFFAFLRESGLVDAAICSEPEAFRILALHSKEFRFPTMLVTLALVPIVINLMSNWLYDELKAKPDDTVTFKLVVENSPNKGCLTFEYRGNVAAVPDKVLELAKSCGALTGDSSAARNPAPTP